MQVAFAEPGYAGVSCLVVPLADDGALGAQGKALDAACDGLITRARSWGKGLKRGQFRELLMPKGFDGELIVLMGLGDLGSLKPIDAEKLGGSLGDRLVALRVDKASVLMEGEAAAHALAIARGAALKAYRFDRYRSKRAHGGEDGDNGDNGSAAKLDELTIGCPEWADLRAAWPGEQAVVDAVHHARDLVSEPANELYPATFAEACRSLSELGVEVEILEQADLQRIGMRALLAVGQGSARESYVAVMHWKGGQEGEPPVALVGKGVCFDTGGISLKPAAGMEGMKWDMGGAGAVFGAMKALAGRKARANVIGLLGLVENMPSGTATRPGDVVTSLSGQTIEIINTDAEGRLVLADVLWYAKETYQPKAMVNLATLTGAIIVALGHERAGLFGSDAGLGDALLKAGDAVGEPLWQLPLDDAYKSHIKSAIADMKNTGRARQAGSIAAAVFLQRFVGDIPWAHIDIAGTAWADKGGAVWPKGATGFGVRLLDRWIAANHEQ
ncbi:MAG: leucyl aminopeptidase [Geminicoccaceae bacterium]